MASQQNFSLPGVGSTVQPPGTVRKMVGGKGAAHGSNSASGGLRTTHTVAAVMREIKKASSIMVHNEIKLRSFAWQEGYAAIAVSPTSIASVRSYIENQEKHHRHKSFDEELEEIFKAAGMPFESGVDMR